MGARDCIQIDVRQTALDAMDHGVFVLSADRATVLFRNRRGRALIGDGWPRPLADAIEQFVAGRANRRRSPLSARVVLDGQAFFLRVIAASEAPPVEVVVLYEEARGDLELLRVLEERFGVTRREYQIISALRVGKTNRQIAANLQLAEGTVARHLHRLLQRLSVHNRTELVHVVDELLRQRGA